MKTANIVEMAGDLDRIVALASDIERWPAILPHYRWVTLLAGEGDRKIVEMAARRGNVPVKWRAIQRIDRTGAIPIIHFQHIWGITKGMDVQWTFRPRADDVVVRIDHWFRSPWPLIGNIASERVIGPHFVEAIASRTLATMKSIVEAERGGGQA